METENENLVARYWDEFWNKGDLDVADDIFSADCVNQDPATPSVKPGPEGMKDLCRGYRAAFPDLRFAVDQQIACGDHVVSHWKASGTHDGELFGVAPTGRQVQVEGISILPVKDGRITGQTVVWDALGLMRQIGALPDS